jgi:ribulose-phosphate 3-epimerase
MHQYECTALIITNSTLFAILVCSWIISILEESFMYGVAMTTYQEVLIAPSILAADFTRLGEQVRDAQLGGANWIHIDVMDGRFVPNITMGPLVVEAVRRVTDLPLDVHLMIVEPEKFVEQFARAGANSISVHLEASPNLHRTLQQIREQGCRVGVAINPHTPAEALAEVLPMVDIVNVMTVNPGFGGQAFITSMQSKIARLRAMIAELKRDVDIEVDGGINVDTALRAVQSGANVLIAGTSVFEHKNGIAAGIRMLHEALDRELE